jgi:hypothetical protein
MEHYGGMFRAFEHCLGRIHSGSTLPSRARKKNYHQEGLRTFLRFIRGAGRPRKLLCLISSQQAKIVNKPLPGRRLFPVLEWWVSGPECG